MLRVLIISAMLCVVQCKLINLSCQDIRTLVDGHNWRRMMLAKGGVPGYPPATDMKFMVWDNELAAKAAAWAIRNEHIHNPNRRIGSDRFKTGENIYWYGTTAKNFKLDLDSPLKSWWDEYKLWKYGPLRQSDFGTGKADIGHYTQMAWAKSTQLGCAVSRVSQNGWDKYFVVCNYGPGGNYMREFPYRKGASGKQLTCGGDCSRPYGDRC